MCLPCVKSVVVVFDGREHGCGRRTKVVPVIAYSVALLSMRLIRLRSTTAVSAVPFSCRIGIRIRTQARSAAV